MAVIIAAAVSGLLLGLGLMLSGMARPDVVLGFLDPLGAWNPALGFVMAGAIPVAAVGFFVARRRGCGVCAPTLHFPTSQIIDARLLIGAVLFGVGWGLAGICPAPAVALLPRAPLAALTFLVPMVIGLLIAPHLRFRAPQLERPAGGSAAGGPARG